MLHSFSSLLHSRKFLLLVLDMIISVVLFFVGKYAVATIFEDVKFMIAVLQPVIIAVIGSIAWEDAAAKRAAGLMMRIPAESPRLRDL